ncbi:MAG: S8 family serine peptidase [Candidatus Asgardarchaeia archaeon]
MSKKQVFTLLFLIAVSTYMNSLIFHPPLFKKFSQDFRYCCYNPDFEYEFIVLLNGELDDKTILIMKNYGEIKYIYKSINALDIIVKPVKLFMISPLNFVKKIVPNSKVRVLSQNENNLYSSDGILHQNKIEGSTSHSSSYVEDLGIDEVWSKYRARGNGVVVAVLDTGINPNHLSLDDLDDDPKTFDPKVIAFKDFIKGFEDLDPSDGMEAYDDNGHGTKVSSVIAGTGAPDRYPGVAPMAKIVSLKILDENGTGENADLIAALQWCIDHKEEFNIDVVSLSLGSDEEVKDGTSLISLMADEVVKNGMVVVAASGNDGEYYSVNAPGDARLVLTVGSYSYISGGTVSPFSSKGPTIDGRVKPEVVAPGKNVPVANPLTNDSYTFDSGTSFSTAIVSGSVCLIVEVLRDKGISFSPLKIKYSLMFTAKPLGGEYPSYEWGWGLIQVYDALSQALKNETLEGISVDYEVNSVYELQNGGKLINLEIHTSEPNTSVCIIVWSDEILYGLCSTTNKSGVTLFPVYIGPEILDRELKLEILCYKVGFDFNSTKVDISEYVKNPLMINTELIIAISLVSLSVVMVFVFLGRKKRKELPEGFEGRPMGDVTDL